MSGIYLKGVGMPKKGSLQVIIHSDGRALIDCGPVYEDAEALIVPDHGDLIDVDKLMALFGLCRDCENCGWRRNDGYCGSRIEDVCKGMYYAEVVIPADRSEDDQKAD